MRRVLVVCGAGASSTFLAHRMRRLATESDQPLTVEAGSESDLEALVVGIDVVLVGPHLASRFADIERAVAREGSTALLLPATVYSSTGAADALRTITEAAPLHPTGPFPTGSPSDPTILPHDLIKE
ncbi:PTS sugar transporter subunit IIB [Planctomonas psychrotolerans]|uniref:PTS sugar transporter subunit IIB n=1 Tax=Planctomonas psychrotolerans TaxID=2528712 RepID=UPI00123BF028|nr:PTS sugar transporter [Planctomonas psychrotolerans]